MQKSPDGDVPQSFVEFYNRKLPETCATMCSTLLKRSSDNFMRGNSVADESSIVEPSQFCLKIKHESEHCFEETNTKVDNRVHQHQQY